MAISQFLSLLTTAVTVNSFSTRDAYGAPTYATAASTYSARIVTAPTLAVGPVGQEIVAQHVAWVATTSRITVEDKLTWNGSTYRIRQVEAPTTGKGVHHVKVLFG